MTKNGKIHNRQDWNNFALGYLHIAELAFEEILTEKHENSDYSIEEIFIPGLYNLKHGIEIVLKALDITLFEKDELKGGDYTHNINDIFSKLKDGVNRKSLNEALKELNKQNPDSEEEISSVDAILSELEIIIKKYHNLDFLRKRLEREDYSVVDSDNTALKYPVNSLVIQINYENLSKKFTEDDVIESLKDTIKLQTIFYKFLTIFMHKKLLEKSD